MFQYTVMIFLKKRAAIWRYYTRDLRMARTYNGNIAVCDNTHEGENRFGVAHVLHDIILSLLLHHGIVHPQILER